VQDHARPRAASHLVTEILVLCTANHCRSAMTESLLRHRLAAVGVTATIRSAGVSVPAAGPASDSALRERAEPPAEVITALAAYELDAAAHRSRALSDGDLAGSDLVLAMAREHLRHAVVELPGAWPRAFTLKELVRRGQQIGPRRAGESLAGWLGRAHDGRDRSALLGDSPDDDVADPTGGPPHAYAVTAEQLDQLLARLV
jgi:protein-tyrosine phosphatase